MSDFTVKTQTFCLFSKIHPKFLFSQLKLLLKQICSQKDFHTEEITHHRFSLKVCDNSKLVTASKSRPVHTAVVGRDDALFPWQRFCHIYTKDAKTSGRLLYISFSLKLSWMLLIRHIFDNPSSAGQSPGLSGAQVWGQTGSRSR